MPQKRARRIQRFFGRVFYSPRTSRSTCAAASSRLSSVIHIKDGLANREGKPLGLGTAPVAAVYKKAVEMGIPMVVESETLQPDGLTEAKICIDYLKSQEA